MTTEEADALLDDWSHKAWTTEGWQASEQVDAVWAFVRETADALAATEDVARRLQAEKAQLEGDRDELYEELSSTKAALGEALEEVVKLEHQIEILKKEAPDAR